MGHSLTRVSDDHYENLPAIPWTGILRLPGNRVLAAILILWALMIAPDPDPGPEIPEIIVEKPAPPLKAVIGDAKGSSPLKRFPTGAGAPIDREAFIISFKRQAARDALPCLRGAKPSPASANVMATLLKTGQLKNLRPVGTGDGFPDCLIAAVVKMNFAPVAASLSSDSQELSWRIDW